MPLGTARTSLALQPSRRESSWYFVGDGAILFNEAVTALAQLPGQITTLDPVLGRLLGERGHGGSVGVSLTRALSRRLSADLSLDYNLARLEVTENNRDAFDETRASFVSAFDGLIRFNPNRVLDSVTSTAALEGEGGRQVVTSATLIVNLRTTGDVIPSAAVGDGVISTTGKIPTATLQGNYRFLLPGGAPIDETDNVTVRHDLTSHTVAGVLGGGVKYYVSPRWGVRIGARLSLSGNAANTVLDAAPRVAIGLAPPGRGVLGSEPSIPFSNNSSDPVTALNVTAVAASTLTGPAIAGLRTFSGSGVFRDANIRAGVFWRF